MVSNNVKSFVIRALRRSSLRWYARNACMKRAKKARNQYECAHCHNIFGRKDVHLDHKEPVIDPLKGFESFDIYIERLFVPETGYQLLCKPCHEVKTQWENAVRVARRTEGEDQIAPKRKRKKKNDD